jgi:xanthine dehydrogenase FAD-binding subunit
MGTVGGNIANGAPSADTAPALFCHNTTIKIADKSGVCEMPIAEFYKGPGWVNLEQGQIITSFLIKKADYENFNGHYIKFSRRRAMDISTLGCAVLVRMDGDKIADLRLAYGVAGPTPLRAAAAEAFSAGLKLSDVNLQKIGEKALESCKARDSWRASKAFREALIVELAGRAIKKAVNGDEN